MRSILELLQNETTVWFYLKEQETKQRFVKELNLLGATYLNGAPVTAESCSPIMAVHPDGKVAHLMIRIWNASFSPSFPMQYAGDVNKIRKVDYAKYVSGEEDFLCQRTAFMPIL